MKSCSCGSRIWKEIESVGACRVAVDVMTASGAGASFLLSSNQRTRVIGREVAVTRPRIARKEQPPSRLSAMPVAPSIFDPPIDFCHWIFRCYRASLPTHHTALCRRDAPRHRYRSRWCTLSRGLLHPVLHGHPVRNRVRFLPVTSARQAGSSGESLKIQDVVFIVMSVVRCRDITT